MALFIGAKSNQTSLTVSLRSTPFSFYPMFPTLDYVVNFSTSEFHGFRVNTRAIC